MFECFKIRQPSLGRKERQSSLLVEPPEPRTNSILNTLNSLGTPKCVGRPGTQTQEWPTQHIDSYENKSRQWKKWRGEKHGPSWGARRHSESCLCYGSHGIFVIAYSCYSYSYRQNLCLMVLVFRIRKDPHLNWSPGSGSTLGMQIWIWIQDLKFHPNLRVFPCFLSEFSRVFLIKKCPNKPICYFLGDFVGFFWTSSLLM